MNEIFNKFLLAGDKFMPKMHFRQPGFTYIDKLDDIVNKYNNTYHSTIKMKLVDVKSNTYINSKEITSENHKFKIGDVVRTSKYRNIFCKKLCSKLV